MCFRAKVSDNLVISIVKVNILLNHKTKTNFTYENGRLKSSKKYTIVGGVSTLIETSIYEHEEGDCYYLYPETKYTDFYPIIEHICPK